MQKNDLLVLTGSKQERDAVEFAFRFRSSRREHDIFESEGAIVEDVEFLLEVVDTAYAGESFDVAVVVKSKSENTRNVKLNLTAVQCFYTGVPAKKVKGSKQEFLLNSNAGKLCCNSFWSASVKSQAAINKYKSKPFF